MSGHVDEITPVGGADAGAKTAPASTPPTIKNQSQ